MTDDVSIIAKHIGFYVDFYSLVLNKEARKSSKNTDWKSYSQVGAAAPNQTGQYDLGFKTAVGEDKKT